MHDMCTEIEKYLIIANVPSRDCSSPPLALRGCSDLIRPDWELSKRAMRQFAE
jgi:hypothetical protein